MAITHRQLAKRRHEDRLVDALSCLDCDAARGERCRYRGREVITCCQAREDFAQAIMQADFSCRLLQIQWGLIEWPYS